MILYRTRYIQTFRDQDRDINFVYDLTGSKDIHLLIGGIELLLLFVQTNCTISNDLYMQ